MRRLAWILALALFPLSALWIAVGPHVPALSHTVSMTALLLVVVGLVWARTRARP